MAETGDMTGQWFGRSYPDGADQSLVIVNIEPRSAANALVIGIEPRFQLRTLSIGTIESDMGGFIGKTKDYHVYDPDPAVDDFVPLEVFYKRKGVEGEPPREASYSAVFNDDKLSGQFTNNLGHTGRFELWRSFYEARFGQARKPEAISQPVTWDEFKQQASLFRNRGQMLFRGQNSTAPLRTLFHRMKRNNLFRYVREDVAQLRHHINAISPYCYRNFGEDITGLLSLAQHHGFPTPLLDWTLSPYIAAFFAFDCHKVDKSEWRVQKAKEPTPARVFTFDWEKWRNAKRQWAQSLKDPWPDYQFFHPPAHNNARYYPQQSVAAFSNIDNIEDFVAAVEMEHNVKYLTKIDINADQREAVEDELRFMGITPATLFPGFEGACKSLRSELF